MARKSLLDPTAGKKSIPGKIRSFIQNLITPEDELLAEKVVEMGSVAPNYQNSIWSWQSGGGQAGLGFAQEIPNMLRDPVISSAVNLLMSTCFQLSAEQKIFWPKSEYQVLVDELEKFHSRTLIQKRILTLGYNIIVWGNVPIKLVYNRDNELEQFKLIGDYNSIIPIVVAGKTIGHLVNGEYHYPLEYVFAQAQYNHDLGGPFGHGLIKLGAANYSSAGGAVMNMSGGGMTGLDSDDDLLTLENEFTLAPSYVANAVRPWRNIKIIEDALLLARLDQSNYFRIFTVNVGPSVESKAAVRLLDYYRNLFKRVRRVSYDSSGISSVGGGAEFEVILPSNNVQGGVKVEDIGGQCLRGTTLVRLTDGRDIPISELYAHPELYTGVTQHWTISNPINTDYSDVQVSRTRGVSVYTSGVTELDTFKIGTAPLTITLCNRHNATFKRITLDNGMSFECTPDHRVLMATPLTNGLPNFKAVSELVVGDHLFAWYGGTRRLAPGPESTPESGNYPVRDLAYVPPHQVVSIENVVDSDGSLIVEDAYDIGLADPRHNYALSCGVFVHNSDVKALKDLDVQYQRLFASLNLQPSQIGFGQGQSSNINMGASPEEAWEARWMRTCKTTLFSTLDAVKQIDLYYLRSKGYRVDESDWSYGTVLQSQIDDHERTEVLKGALLNLKTFGEAVSTLQIEQYNKSYLVKSLLGSALDVLDMDPDKLLEPDSTQPAVPQQLQQNYNLKREELIGITNTLDLDGSFPQLVSSMKAFLDLDDLGSDHKLIKGEYTPNSVTFHQIQSGAAYLSYPQAQIDLDTFFKRYESLPVHSLIDSDHQLVHSIDLSSQFFIPADLEPVTVQEFSQSGIAAITKAVSFGSKAFAIPNRDDVLTLMHLKLDGSYTAIVSNLYEVV